MSQDPANLLIGIIVGAIGVFAAGFGAGKYTEKRSNEMKQLRQELEKVQTRLSTSIETDPDLAKWMNDNAPQIMKLLNKMMGDNNKNGT